MLSRRPLSSRQCLQRLYTTQLHHHTNGSYSHLGLRSRHPPDSSSSKPQQKDNGAEPEPSKKRKRSPESEEISDSEWNLRTGRAVYTLQQTLPDFFNTGLVSTMSEKTKKASFAELIIPSDGQHDEGHDPGIYSPKVRLSYTPPAALPAPFPQTLHIEGFPLYLTSSVFIRHTLNALYSDVSVTLSKLSSPPSASAPSFRSSTAQPGSPTGHKKKVSRDKSVILSMSVIGTSRMSGTKAQWDIKCTYTFSPISGLILSHVVDEIDPAPHMSAYDALRAALGMRQWIGTPGASTAPTAVSAPAGSGGGERVVRVKAE